MIQSHLFILAACIVFGKLAASAIDEKTTGDLNFPGTYGLMDEETDLEDDILDYADEYPLEGLPKITFKLPSGILDIGGNFTFSGYEKMQNILKGDLTMLYKANNGFFGSLRFDGELFSGFISSKVQAKIGLYF